MHGDETRTERSFCRICTCLCGILVEVQGDQVLRVRGDKSHPVTQGYVCPKGRALPRLHHHPRRLEHPLLKVADALQPTSWDRCLDDLAARLRTVIDRHGPASVGIFYGSGLGMDAAGYRMGEALQRSIQTPARFSPMTIDGTAKTLIASVMGGFPGFSPRADYGQAKLILYIGVNPMVSHGHNVAVPNPAVPIRAAARDGEVWVIDPVHTETAKFASRHLAPHPGTDYALLAYLVRELLSGGVDEDMLARRTVDGNALRAAVAPFTRERAAALTGVPAEALSDLLASVRKAGRLAVETGTGVTMSATANVTQWLAWALMIVTDSMNRPGGVWFHPGFITRYDAAPLPVMTEIFGPGPQSRPELPSVLGDWPCAALVSEIEAGNIRALINLGGSIIRSFPDANALRGALGKLDVLATLEIIANESTELSTHVLPTKDQLERPDLTLWDFLNPRVSAQYTPAVVAPAGERRSAWWILAQLIRRLGHEPPACLPEDDRQDGADDAVLAPQTQYGRSSFAELSSRRYAEAERELPARWVEEHIDRLGGWRLAPAPLVEQLAALNDSQTEREAPAQLRLTPRRQRRHLNATLEFLGSPADVLLHPADAAAAGIADGQPVIVRSSTGELVGTARIDGSILAGAVSVPHGHEHANVNLLTDIHKVDPLTGMAIYSGVPVTVHPLSELKAP